MQDFSEQKLQQYVAQIESLILEKEVVQGKISEIFKDAKSEGFDTKIMRKLISIRKKKPEELSTEETMLQIYAKALDMEI